MNATPKIEIQPALLTIDQAATYLTVSPATLFTWRSRRPGYGPRAVKVGSLLRYRRADLDAWLAGLQDAS